MYAGKLTVPRRGYAPAITLFAAGFAVLAWPWLSGALTIPWDAKAQFQPELQFLATSLAHGEEPFWTPNLFAGWPQIADPQSLIFSPLHLALAAFDATPSFHAADLLTFAYLFAGGLALMLFFRDRGWHPGGALAAALIFAFGGSAASRLQHTSEIISLAYLPMALWLLARTLECTTVSEKANSTNGAAASTTAQAPRRTWPTAIAAGVVIALLAIGRDQVALLGLYVLALYVVAWWLDGPERLVRIRQSLPPLLLCGAIAVVLAAVPLTFSALLAVDSNRPSITFEHAGGGSLHPALLLMLVFSDLFGAANPRVDFWGPPSTAWYTTIGPSNLALAQNMGEIYCGILAVIVLAAGLVRGALWARDIRFFPAVLVLVLLYALGWYTPAFRAMYDTLPGVDLFRRPADATFIIGFLIAVIAGYLVHRALSGTARWRWFPEIECTFMALVTAIAVAIAARTGQVPVAALPIATGLGFAAVAVALLAVLQRVAPARPGSAGEWLATLSVFAFIVADFAWNNGPNESTGLPPSLYEALRPQGNDPTVALIKAKLAETAAPDRRDRVELIGIAYHWPNVALAQGFDHLFGHNPLRLADFTRATGVGDTVAEPVQRTFAPLFPSYRSTFADLCGDRFIITGVPVEYIDKSLKASDLPLIARTKDAYVYENPRALPRVMVVPDYRIADFGDLMRHGWPDDADPRRVVLLEHARRSAATNAPTSANPAKGADTTPQHILLKLADGAGDVAAPPDAPTDAQPDATPAEALPGTARILRYANTEADIEVEALAGGFLVLNDVWHPWWRAEVDGSPADILKANVLFRAVAVTPGKHRVRFVFEPFHGAFDELLQKVTALL
jgi:hypothetical protein